jgi:hypothetical protein
MKKFVFWLASMNLIVSIPYTITTRVGGDKFWKLERTETVPKMATGSACQAPLESSM